VELDAELAEIDENLRSHHLTRAEEARHIARREELMQAKGERRTVGRHSNTATVAVLEPKTTEELAKEAGMSERTYQQRAKSKKLELLEEIPNLEKPTKVRELCEVHAYRDGAKAQPGAQPSHV
jgi:hypothetical protein